MSGLLKYVIKFRESQVGSASVEFVILFPLFMFVMMSGFESGFYMVRNVMMDRAVDIAMRDVRLGNTINTPGAPPDLTALKHRICEEASIIPNCMQLVQIEMQPVEIAPGGVDAFGQNLRCIDTEADDGALQDTVYDTGRDNSLMVVRVCTLANPLFPTTGIGAGMAYDGQGNYALVTTAAFVNEPGQRSRVVTNGGGASF